MKFTDGHVNAASLTNIKRAAAAAVMIEHQYYQLHIDSLTFSHHQHTLTACQYIHY